MKKIFVCFCLIFALSCVIDLKQFAHTIECRVEGGHGTLEISPSQSTYRYSDALKLVVTPESGYWIKDIYAYHLIGNKYHAKLNYTTKMLVGEKGSQATGVEIPYRMGGYDTVIRCTFESQSAPEIPSD